MKLEVGKWYKDSDGTVVKIVDSIGGVFYFFTGNNGKLYNPHGVACTNNPGTLVAEVPELSLGDWCINEGRVPDADVTAVRYRDGSIQPCSVDAKDGLDWVLGGGDSDIVAYCTSPFESVTCSSNEVFPDIREMYEAAAAVKMRREFNTESVGEKPKERVVHIGDPISVSNITVTFNGREMPFKAKLDDTEVSIVLSPEGAPNSDTPVAGGLQFTLDGIESPDIDMAEPGYETLADVLQRAYDQAAKGKGKERHAQAGEPFDEQVMQQGAQRFGVGALLFQAFKKSEESQRLPHEAAIKELLGGIVYLAGAVIALEKGKPL